MNKNVIKVFSVFLCVVMTFSIFAFSVSAEGGKANFKLSKSGEIVVGEQIDIFITVENASNLSMGDIELTYEPNDFNYVDIISADKSDTMFLGDKKQDGNIIFSFIRFDSVSGSYDIAVLTLIPLTEDAKISLHAISFTADKPVDDAEFLLSETEIRTLEPDTPETVLEYKFVDGHAVVARCDTKATGIIEIPAEIEGYPVTEIEANAFAHCGQINEVVIPEGVTKIGYSAFMLCSRLRKVHLPETLETIEASAFYMCGSLDNVVIPEGVTEIAEHTFYECTTLENIKLPKNLKSIGDSAFCKTSIKKIDLPSGLKSIGASVFNTTPLEEIIIPYGITEIYGSAFRNCKDLAHVELPETVEFIGSYAFYGCEKMKSITIPASVTEMSYMSVGYNNEMFPVNLFTIYGSKGSEAERYAASHRIGFVALDDDSSLYDVNCDGKITAADARQALRTAAQLQGLEGKYFFAADVDKDGKITASDARLILRKAAQLD